MRVGSSVRFQEGLASGYVINLVMVCWWRGSVADDVFANFDS